MAGWVDHCEQLLDPLVAALGRYVLAARKVHADDTPVKVLQPGTGKTRQGALWVYVRDVDLLRMHEVPRPCHDVASTSPPTGLPLRRAI